MIKISLSHNNHKTISIIVDFLVVVVVAVVVVTDAFETVGLHNRGRFAF